MKDENKNLARLGDLVKSNNIEEIKAILARFENGSDHPLLDHYSSERYKGCALRDALLMGNEDIVRLLLAAGVSANAMTFREGYSGGLRPMIAFAAQSGKLSLVKLLVEHGAKFYHTKMDDRDNWNDDFGLRTAVIKGHTDIVEYLLERGASANGLCGGGTLGEMHGGTTFLARAAMDANIPMVELLLKHGAKIPTALNLIHEKIYKHGFKEYEQHIKNNYSDEHRISTISCGSDLIPSPIKYNGYSLSDEAEQFFAQLNDLLSDVNTILNSTEEKTKIVKSIEAILSKQFQIVKSTDTTLHELERYLRYLQEFDNKKQELIRKHDVLKNDYIRVVKTLLDYAMGCDFESSKNGEFGEYRGLHFLKPLDISAFNFLGVSVGGTPVNRDMLKHLPGADNALITESDLSLLNDEARKTGINARLARAFLRKGRLINEGIINLVPLPRTAEIGDRIALKARLAAGANPNEQQLEGQYPLVIAARKGHYDCVVDLYQAHVQHREQKGKRLHKEAKEFLASHPKETALKIEKGHLKKHEAPFAIPNCLAIIKGKYARLSRMVNRMGAQNLHATVEKTMTDAAAQGMRVMLVIDVYGKVHQQFYKKNIGRGEIKNWWQILIIGPNRAESIFQ